MIYTLIPRGFGYYYFHRPSVARVYFRHCYQDLLTGETFAFSISDLKKRLEQTPMSSKKPIIWHLFYELGLSFNELDALISKNDILAIEIHYLKFSKIKKEKARPIELFGQKGPLFKEYEESFDYIYSHLMRGDCYQVNLTYPFNISHKEDFKSICNSLWRVKKKIAPYAHGTYLGPLKKGIISNSPECLFQMEKDDLKNEWILQTMPIKGSMAFDSKKSSFKKTWEKLKKDKKEQAELYMITDLLRNDLNRIETPNAFVLEKKKPLEVPGILHQYSLLQVRLSSKVNLLQILRALFPGGSITGAPKKNVMKYIEQIEQGSRGIYCGSTLIIHNRILRSSINIRTALYDETKKTLRLGAGGGVTLQSDIHQEFQEMEIKAQSFLQNLIS